MGKKEARRPSTVIPCLGKVEILLLTGPLRIEMRLLGKLVLILPLYHIMGGHFCE